MHAYTYIRKVGTEYMSSNEESRDPLRGNLTHAYINVPPYKFIIKF